jgi:hypothetical protein
MDEKFHAPTLNSLDGNTEYLKQFRFSTHFCSGTIIPQVAQIYQK